MPMPNHTPTLKTMPTEWMDRVSVEMLVEVMIEHTGPIMHADLAEQAARSFKGKSNGETMFAIVGLMALWAETAPSYETAIMSLAAIALRLREVTLQ